MEFNETKIMFTVRHKTSTKHKITNVNHLLKRRNIKHTAET